MAQSFAAKQQNWLTRFESLLVQIDANMSALTELTNEFSDETYGSGGANALTDAVVQGVLPAATAAMVWSAEGAAAGSGGFISAYATFRGYVNNMRP